MTLLGLAFNVMMDAGTCAREAGCGVAAEGREDAVQPSQLSSLGQQPILAKVPQRRCSLYGSLTSRLTTDPVDAPQCCESCGCSVA